jgi:endonuclease-3
MKDAQVAALFQRFAEANPDPRGELEYKNAYTLLVAVVLSAQATDTGVNKATKALFKAADTPAKMLALGEPSLREHIKTIGLYNSKAKNVIKLSEILEKQYSGKVPNSRDALEQLPGVGRKTANVVLGNAFGKNEGVVVDTHVQRLSQRLRFTEQTQPEKIEQDLMEIVPKKDWTIFSLRLILHGRQICQARKPKCLECALAPDCPSRQI